MNGVPTMFIALLENPEFPNTDFSHLRTGIMAGSPCPVKTMEEIMEKMYMREVTICYGLTEGSPVLSQTTVTDSVRKNARNPAELTKILCLRCHSDQDPEGGHLYASKKDPTGEMVLCVVTGVDQAALQALVPLDRSQRVLRPVGSDFTNKIPQTLADGTVRSTLITDNVNWNARNFFRGPGSWNQDISVFKSFQLTERVKTRFTADFFNALNHANDGGVDAATGLQDLSTQANDPRIIQFSLRVEW